MNLGLIMSTLQMIGGGFMLASYIPQIKMLLESKSSENQSIKFWVILDIGMLLFDLNAIYLMIALGQYSYAVTQTLNLLCGVIVLALLLKYRKKKII